MVTCRGMVNVLLREGPHGVTFRYIGQDTDGAVAYLQAADNVARLLPIRLRGVNQPVIRSPHPFSSPHPARLACL